MFNTDPGEISKYDEAFKIFKSLSPEFQDYALELIKKLVEIQNRGN